MIVPPSACNSTESELGLELRAQDGWHREEENPPSVLPAFTALQQRSKARTTPLLCQIAIFNVFIRIVFISLSNRRNNITNSKL